MKAIRMSESISESGIVISVNLSTATGTCKSPVPRIKINERGVDGDAHAGPWHRQVSLLAAEQIERFAAELGRDFGWGEFAENITTRGIALTSAAVADRLSVGMAELEVTQIGKKCHGDGCAIFQQVGQCIMPREGIFCRVVRAGTVEPGNTIAFLRRTLTCRVITLSDRARAGVYADRSGPRVAELLEDFCRSAGWKAEIKSEILPDEAAQLTDALHAAKADGADLTVTTGGTGIGPRDITPDVVLSMADKIIPGVMDQIRLNCGTRNPNALLSRSVAAVMGKMLVWTLPGSVRAVDEYLPELLKTLEHAVFTLRGLDTH